MRKTHKYASVFIADNQGFEGSDREQYNLCLVNFRHYAHIWYEAAAVCVDGARMDAARLVMKRGCEALPMRGPRLAWTPCTPDWHCTLHTALYKLTLHPAHYPPNPSLVLEAVLGFP